ncbi:hypothetical protein KAT92_03830 [Candidatus Babeliales bacterium]|nr:hypothetical protein [Candidatus Babeliales bacterium]
MSNGQGNGYFLIEMLVAIALLALFLSILARYQWLSWQQHQQIVVRTEALSQGREERAGLENLRVAPSKALRTQLERLPCAKHLPS